MHPVAQKIAERFPQAFLEAREYRGELTVVVKREQIVEIARFLHDEPGLGFDHLSDICSVDHPDREERFEVVYQLNSIHRRHRLRLKASVPEDDGVIDSVCPIWRGANFLEREVYDLMGIRFRGHPDLRRIFLPEDFDGHPLRKEYPADGKGWRNTFEFLQKGESQTPLFHEQRLADAAKVGPRPTEEVEGLPLRRTEELLLNLGPQHPATHGVLRVVLELEGEKIIKATPDLGYLHRGVEKLCEGLTYQQIIPHTDRLDYICSMTNNFAYVRAVEKLLGITVPIRAEHVRTIVAEMQRIVGHLFWLGTQALDIGAMTIFFWTFREREALLDLFEMLCGARLTLNYYRVGGVDSDLTPEIITRLRKFLKDFPSKINEYDALLLNNRIWMARTKNVAVITASDAIHFGLTGPPLRGSGVYYDVRKAEPYAAYDKVEWEVPLGKNGDTYDRYWVRMQEMKQSARIIEQCLDQLPEGPILSDVPQVVPPPKEMVMVDMQALIHHFIIFTEGFKPPKGEVYCATEAPKGELGFYIVSDGSPKPYRLKIRSPSFVHLGAFDHMARGYMIADIITIFGTYDIVMGECDR